MQRRAKKTGSLYQRCDTTRGCPALIPGAPDPLSGKPTEVRPKHTCKGPWVAAVTLPNLTGQRRRKVIVRAKKADALAELNKVRDQLERAGDLATSSPTLSAWLDVWWKRYAMKRIKVSARGSYQTRIEQYIRPCLGSVRLDKMTPAHIHRLHDFMADKGLSITTTRGTHRVLSAVLADALTEDKVTRNLCLVVPAPEAAVYNVKYLDNGQARQLLTAHDPGDGTVPQDLAQLAVALLTGQRPGERLGLTEEFIDLRRGTMTIAWQLKRLSFEHGCGPQATNKTWPCGRRKGGYCPQRHIDIPSNQEVRHVDAGLYLLRPKTKAGWRTFPMVGVLSDIMTTYLETHTPGKEGLIFTRPDGRPIDPSHDAKAWARALASAGVPNVQPRTARHTCNTILTELGIPVDVRIQIIGHASRAVNEQVYTHTSDVRIEDAMKTLTTAMDWRALPRAE